ncbi:MAG: MotA/TolQ/ExbB proton channel family protein [Pseudobdellovibrio sp.]
MSEILNFIKESGVVGWTILATGVAVLALAFERIRTLYFEFGLNVEQFVGKIQTLVLSKKIDEAIVTCAQMETKPLARAFKVILEKADRDDETIFQAQDIALAEAVPAYTKRLHYLSMLANVATLLGLLGTIHGLIVSFQAVAQADPAAKQAMLAKGIAVSMYTTALGLAVAIPAMVLFSFLTSRQNELLEQLQEKTSKLTETLTSSMMPSVNKSNVYPETNHVPTSTVVPPSHGSKAS